MEAWVEVLTTDAEGIRFKLPDEVEIIEEGLIIFIDASSKFGLKVFCLEWKAHGCPLVYNPTNKATKVLLKKPYFPNGVAFSKTKPQS